MKYKNFKKELKRKKEQEQTLRELRGAINTLTAKRDRYAEESKQALKMGNESLYMAKVALLKHAIFNLKQAQDMEANFTIAKDMCEMQHLNKKFVSSLNSVMKNVYKTCKAIHVSSSEKTFMKALFKQNQTSLELQNALKNNNMTFASSVTSLSDISDEEINKFLKEEMLTEQISLENELDSIEEKLFGEVQQKSPEKQVEVMGGPTIAKPEVKVDTVQGGFESKAENKIDSILDQVSIEEKEQNKTRPEDEILGEEAGEDGFVWDNIPTIGFDDIAGLEEVKEVVKVKVLLPLKNPEAFEGYEKKNGGGLCLYGPPGTGKTMIAAAIAKEIGAKFCSVKPSDLLRQGAGNTEKAVRTLFRQARKFDCAVIYFDEMDSISPKSTRSQYAKQLRSEFLAQLQGVESYGKDKGNILFLICATNKPWDIDSAFLRPGRFGTKVYVGLPDAPAREYMIRKRIEKIKAKGVVAINENIDVDFIVDKTNGFNGSDITNLLDRIEEISIVRGINSGSKYIENDDFVKALESVHSSVQTEDLIKLKEWMNENDK